LTAKLTDKDDAPRKVTMAIFFSIPTEVVQTVVSEVGGISGNRFVFFLFVFTKYEVFN